MKSRTFLLLTVLAIGAASAAVAVEPQTRVDALRGARQKVARAADQTKGSPRQLLIFEQRKLGSLIDDLERGRHVDPSEIDRALERAGQTR